MTTPLPMPPDDADPNDFADRAPDHVREDESKDLGAVSGEEAIDDADAAKRLDLDPEEQPSATDPDYDEGADSAG